MSSTPNNLQIRRQKGEGEGYNQKIKYFICDAAANFRYFHTVKHSLVLQTQIFHKNKPLD